MRKRWLALAAALLRARGALALAESGGDGAEPALVVYQAELTQMMRDPEAWAGRRIEVQGKFNYGEKTGRATVIVCDSTGCCETGLTFVCAEERRYPEDYPALYSDITVSGRFETFDGPDGPDCRLADAQLSWDEQP